MNGILNGQRGVKCPSIDSGGTLMPRVDSDADCGQVFARIRGDVVRGIEGAPSSIEAPYWLHCLTEESKEIVEIEVAIVLDLEDMGDIVAFK